MMCTIKTFYTSAMLVIKVSCLYNRKLTRKHTCLSKSADQTKKTWLCSTYGLWSHCCRTKGKSVFLLFSKPADSMSFRINWCPFFPEWAHGKFGWSLVLVCSGTTVKSHAALFPLTASKAAAWLQLSDLLSGCCQSVIVLTVPSPSFLSHCVSPCLSLSFSLHFKLSCPLLLPVFSPSTCPDVVVCGLSALPCDDEVILCCHHLMQETSNFFGLCTPFQKQFQLSIPLYSWE